MPISGQDAVLMDAGVYAGKHENLVIASMRSVIDRVERLNAKAGAELAAVQTDFYAGKMGLVEAIDRAEQITGSAVLAAEFGLGASGMAGGGYDESQLDSEIEFDTAGLKAAGELVKQILLSPVVLALAVVGTVLMGVGLAAEAAVSGVGKVIDKAGRLSVPKWFPGKKFWGLCKKARESSSISSIYSESSMAGGGYTFTADDIQVVKDTIKAYREEVEKAYVAVKSRDEGSELRVESKNKREILDMKKTGKYKRDKKGYMLTLDGKLVWGDDGYVMVGGAPKPAAKKPAAKKPVAKKPAAKKPAAKKPAAKKK